jgi:DNA-binding response OmpR family regulator
MAEAQKHDQTLPLNGARVLVVEDDYLISMNLESTLAEAGAEIAGVSRTVKDALALAKQNGVAAAILDFRLGCETVEPVARQLSRRGIPFVFYTGQLEAEHLLGSEWPGCKILRKPSRPQAIVSAIAGVLAPTDASRAFLNRV